MANIDANLALPYLATPRRNILGTASSLGSAIAESLRKRLIYYRTLSDLEGYTERNLLDLGVDGGIEEFARRAARL